MQIYQYMDHFFIYANVTIIKQYQILFGFDVGKRCKKYARKYHISDSVWCKKDIKFMQIMCLLEYLSCCYTLHYF